MDDKAKERCGISNAESIKQGVLKLMRHKGNPVLDEIIKIESSFQRYVYAFYDFSRVGHGNFAHGFTEPIDDELDRENPFKSNQTPSDLIMILDDFYDNKLRNADLSYRTVRKDFESYEKNRGFWKKLFSVQNPNEYIFGRIVSASIKADFCLPAYKDYIDIKSREQKE